MKIFNLFKQILLIFVLCCFFIPVKAEEINVAKATAVAKYLTERQFNTSFSRGEELVLAYTAPNQKSLQTHPVYYVFNVGSEGFIIVSGDDVARPILGYSQNGNYDPNNLPPNFQVWMEGIGSDIAEAIANNLQNDEQTREEWNAYVNRNEEYFTNQNTTRAVNNLLTTTWGQSSPYNNQCPLCSSTRTVTGCVATCMAQLMKYYNHPAQGTGSSTAYSISCGTTVPAVNFNVNYNFSDMGNATPTTTAQQTNVAQLMYHAGASVQMQYGTSSSGAYDDDAALALTTYFKYDKSLRYERRMYFNDNQWIAMLKEDLDAGRPVYYSGVDANGLGGHAFLVTGYNNSDQFYINWGWTGTANGFFAINALKPQSYNFANSNAILSGLKPDAGGAQSYQIYISSNAPGNVLSATKSIVQRSEAFEASARFMNAGYATFPGGYYAIGLYNSSGTLVTITSTILNVPNELPAGYGFTNPFTFSCSVPSSVTPGNYTIKAIVSTTYPNPTWVIAKGTSIDELPLQVVGPTLTITSPTSQLLSFSNTFVGETTASQSVVISGAYLTGNITWALSGTGASSYAVTPNSLGTSGGTFNVTFTPTTAGAQSATLTISSSGAESKTISLSGTGTTPICEITQTGMKYVNLNNALSAVTTNQTIKLLQTITHPSAVSITNKIFTFDMNGYDLNISFLLGNAVILNGSEIKMTGTGEFNVSGGTGTGVNIYNGGKITVTNVTGQTGVQVNNGTAIVTGNTASLSTGYSVRANNGSVTVGGNATGGVWAADNSTVTVEGIVSPNNNNNYIRVGSTYKVEEDGVVSTTNPGYVEYTDDENYVWVRDKNMYFITGSGTAFTAKKAGATVGTANQPIQTVVNAIKTHAAGADCKIFFGNGADELNINTASAEFNYSGTPSWGKISLYGKITSANSGTNSATVVFSNATATAQIEIIGTTIINTATNGNAICNQSAGSIRLGSNPTITGRIYKTSTGNLGALTGTTNTFAPSSGKKYRLHFQTYTSGMTAVENGKNFISNFELANSSYGLLARGEDLVILQLPINIVTVVAGTGGGSYGTGETVTITASTPPAGQIFKQWKVNSGSITFAAPTATTTTFTMPNTAVTVEAVFEAISYGIALNPSGNKDFGSATQGYSAPTAYAVTVNNTGNQATGALTVALSGTNASSFTLSKTSISSIAVGGSDSFTVVPKTGLSVGNYNATVTVSGSNGISASFNVSFTVTLPTYTITVSAGANGSITPATNQTVNHGANQTFTFTPNTGYHINQVLIDGVNNPAAVTSGTYTFSNVTANHSISVSFAINTYTITVNAGANGSITPAINQTVNHGANQTFTITPNTGYHINQVLIDGVNNPMAVANGAYTFSNITENHTIEASFQLLQGIEPNDIASILVFSHNNIVTILNENLISIKEVEIMDMYGRVIWTGKALNTKTDIPLEVAKGIYSVRIATDNQRKTAKVIIN